MDLRELRARRDFINWFCSHFRFISDGQYNITLDQIVDLFIDIYEEQNKQDCPLGRNHMHEILFTSGWLVTDDQSMLCLGLRYATFTERSEEYIAKFLEMDFDFKTKSELRRIRNLNKTAQAIKSVDNKLTDDVTIHLLQFYTTWCADTRVAFTDMSHAWKKAIVGRVYKAYKIFCELNDCRPVDPKVLRKFLEDKGHKHFVGSYACGMSGQSYYNNLYIPGSGYFYRNSDGLTPDGELEFAAVHNQLIVRIGTQYYLNDGQEVLIENGILKKTLDDKLNRLAPVVDTIEHEIIYDMVTERDSKDTDKRYSLDEVMNTVDNQIIADSLSGSEADIEDVEEIMETEVEVDQETIDMLEKLGFSSEKVAEISGKKIRANE